jgi:glutathione S-transferase
MIELFHGGPVGHSASVLMILAEKSLAFESRFIDLATFEQHGDAFLAVNAAGQVPVLREDGRTLIESFFILLYLDERYPDPPLGGADPKARYAAQKWGKYVETHIAPNLAIYGWAQQGARPGGAARAGFDRLPPNRRALWRRASEGFGDGEVDTARAALVKALGRIAEALEAGPWLGGAAYGIADIAVFPHVARMRALGLALPVPVDGWLERIAARHQVREALGNIGVPNGVPTMGPERGRWG